LHESPNEKGTSGWLVPGIFTYTYRIAYLTGVYRRVNGKYFQFGMSGLGEKGGFGGLDKKRWPVGLQ
jgi:hypothetical protein